MRRLWAFALTAFVTVAFCALPVRAWTGKAPSHAPHSIASANRILVLVAVNVERDAVVERLSGARRVWIDERAGLAADRVVLGSRTVDVVVTGYGFENAAPVAKAAFEALRPDVALFIGTAGALDESLALNDIVVASTSRLADGSEKARLDPEISNWLAAGYAARGERVHRGTLVTSRRFAGFREKQAFARAMPGALAVDMEAYAVVLAANARGVPIGAAKAITDRMEPTEGTFEEWRRNAPEASRRAARAIDLL